MSKNLKIVGCVKFSCGQSPSIKINKWPLNIPAAPLSFPPPHLKIRRSEHNTGKT